MIFIRGKFRWRLVILSALMLVGGLEFQGVGASTSKQEVSQAEGWRNESAVLQYLLPVLKKYGMAGRIYYTTSCHADKGYPNSFPKMNVQPPLKDATGLAAVMHMFRSEKHIKVTESPVGIIRVRVGRVPDAVLQTKISSITLSSMEQYNPSMAISALENSEDVHVTMNKLGIHVASRVTNLGIVLPARGLPRLPGSLSNVTMDQSLDLIARVFGGVVIYGDCTKSRTFFVDFVGGMRPDDSGSR